MLWVECTKTLFGNSSKLPLAKWIVIRLMFRKISVWIMQLIVAHLWSVNLLNIWYSKSQTQSVKQFPFFQRQTQNLFIQFVHYEPNIVCSCVMCIQWKITLFFLNICIKCVTSILCIQEISIKCNINAIDVHVHSHHSAIFHGFHNRSDLLFYSSKTTAVNNRKKEMNIEQQFVG